MDALLQDIRYALRQLAARPGFTAIVVLTLALGIGANTTIFSVTNGVLLRPLPIRDESRLVLLQKVAPRDSSLRPFPVMDLDALQERARTLEGVAGVQYDGAFPYVMQEGDRAFSLMASMVSGEFFRILGAAPAVGRLLEPEDARPGTEPVVVISYGLWQRLFGGDPHVVGRTLRHQGSLTIVGVAPRGFEFPKSVEAWVPLQLTPEVAGGRSFEPFSIIGRLRAGATVVQAQAEASAFVRERETLYPPGEALGQRAVVTPFRDVVVGRLRQSVLVLTAAVALVLVIAGVNVANLLLIRGVARQRELALRKALGATPRRIVQQQLIETAILAAVGGVLGVVLAYGSVRWLVAVAPPELPRIAEVSIDGRVLGFAVAVSLATVLCFGLGPALWAARAPVQRPLQGGPRAGRDSRGARITKQLLVVSQVSLALTVVAGAGLLTRSLARLQRVDMGFDAPHITLVKAAVPQDAYGEASRHLAFFDAIVARIEATPGLAATPVVLAPFSGSGGWDAPVTAEGQGQTAAAENPTLNLEPIAPNYFRTLGIPLRRGRAFTDQDREHAPAVAIVSEAAARRLWPAQDAVGKRLKFGPPTSPEPWLQVVGVVGDTRYRLLTTALPGIYVPFRQAAAEPGLLPSYVAVRSTLPPGSVLRMVRSAAKELDPTVPVLDAEPLPRLLAAPLARPRFDSLLLSGFALIALVLAAVGLYGVMATFVGQRTHEIGVRVALGAAAGDLRRLILGKGMVLTLVGVAIGASGALAAGRALSGLLFEVSPVDPMTLAAATVLLLVAAALACVVPARRAARIDPMAALRTE
jgi:putative ABC transport system permease protein